MKSNIDHIIVGLSESCPYCDTNESACVSVDCSITPLRLVPIVERINIIVDMSIEEKEKMYHHHVECLKNKEHIVT